MLQVIIYMDYTERDKICLLILCLYQLRLRDYFFDNQNKAPIGPDDIINMFPIVKHINMPTVDASKAYCAAQNSLRKGR